MTLQAGLRLGRGPLELRVDLDVPAGTVLALLGPNGAGKTTVLRALAGLHGGPVGDVRLGAEVLDGDGVHVPAERRLVGVVFQDLLLFPHLSARDNVAFGLQARGMRRAEARAQAERWLARVDLTPQAASRPRSLSGGQAQRVALARALATGPRLLLLDEPLAALDAATRAAVRSDLRRHLEAYDGSTVVVSHDALDAMVLADHVAVLEQGRVVQTGTPGEVARRPRTPYVAALVGLNLLQGRARGASVTLDGGHVLAVAAAPGDGEALVAFRPAAVALHRHHPEGSPRNTWPATVTGVERHGDLVRVALDGPVPSLADITPAAVADLQLATGARVWAAVKAAETSAYRR